MAGPSGIIILQLKFHQRPKRYLTEESSCTCLSAKNLQARRGGTSSHEDPDKSSTVTIRWDIFLLQYDHQSLVADARVGDTIAQYGRKAESSLPGYKEATPMVFCGLFPVDVDQFPEFHDALEKLQLNDAALKDRVGAFGLPQMHGSTFREITTI